MKEYKFEYSCPLLLSNDRQLNPYLEVEDFFNGASLGYYRGELRSWFRIAMSENRKVKNHSEMIYFHNQLIQLFHAGYLITVNTNTDYTETIERFREWFKKIRHLKIDEGTGIDGNYEIHFLSDDEKTNPLLHLKNILTLGRISEIRFGLQEWQYCSFNSKSTIATMDCEYLTDLLNDMGKVMEILFLLLAGDE